MWSFIQKTKEYHAKNGKERSTKGQEKIQHLLDKGFRPSKKKEEKKLHFSMVEKNQKS